MICYECVELIGSIYGRPLLWSCVGFDAHVCGCIVGSQGHARPLHEESVPCCMVLAIVGERDHIH